MKKQIILCTLVLGICISSVGQISLNDYKYVVVSEKFDFLNEENKYQLNELTKFLFEKYNNNCLGLKSVVKSKSSFINTKMTVKLMDCKGNVVFTSEEGRSKEKSFKKAYHQALRNAFLSFEGINYKYQPTKRSTVSVDTNVELTANTTISKEKTKNVTGVVKEKEKEIEDVAVDQKKLVATLVNDVKNAEANKTRSVATVKNTSVVNPELLYAQPNANGFQLIDSTPKVLYIIQRTSLTDVFVLKNQKGLFFKKGDQWVVEYYDENNQLKQKSVQVKF